MERKNIFSKYKSDFFIETGSYTGDGIQFALECDYQKIYSIELSDKYYSICKEKFKNNSRVEMIRGDSAIILYDLIKDLNGKITFWLDGHFCYGDTARGLYSAPLIQELDQINKHHIKNHNILIDDMRTWIKENFNNYGFYHDDIIKAIKKINLNYKIIYEDGVEIDDVMVAFI